MLILCCGNPDRGDDAAGVLVANQLRQLNVEATVCSGESADLLQRWMGAPDVLLVDSAVTGAPAGTIHMWNAAETKLPPGRSESTHGLGVGIAVELARKLGKLPPRLRVYAIEGEQFGVGIVPSPKVQQAATQLAAKIAAECGAIPG